MLLNGRKRSLKLINKLKDPEINNSIVNDPSRIPNIINKYLIIINNNKIFITVSMYLAHRANWEHLLLQNKLKLCTVS